MVKGLFIPGITAEMFRNGCLEDIEALMAEGEIYDIEYDIQKKEMNEIKPCPFCGGEAEFYTRWGGKYKDPTMDVPIGYYIICTKCFAMTRFTSAKNQDRIGREHLIESTIEAWNRREGEQE